METSKIRYFTKNLSEREYTLMLRKLENNERFLRSAIEKIDGQLHALQVERLHLLHKSNMAKDSSQNQSQAQGKQQNQELDLTIPLKITELEEEEEDEDEFGI